MSLACLRGGEPGRRWRHHAPKPEPKCRTPDLCLSGGTDPLHSSDLAESHGGDDGHKKTHTDCIPGS